MQYKQHNHSLELPLLGISPRFYLLQLLLRVIRYLLFLLLQLILRTLPAIDLKSIDLGNISSGRGLGKEVRVYHQQNIGKRASEVCAVDIVALLLGHVDLLAPRAEDLHPRCSNFLAHTNRQGVLPLAQHPRTHPESTLYVLVPHYRETLRGNYISRMDESVDIGGLLVDGKVSKSHKQYLSSSSSSSSGGSGLSIISRASLNAGGSTYSGRTSA